MMNINLKTKNKRLLIHEDWVVDILGLGIIAIALSGILIHSPKFEWTTLGDLSSIFMDRSNVVLILSQFSFTYLVAIAGTILTGRDLKATLSGFPVVFTLTVGALLLGGSKSMKELNLETVIFSLGIGLLIGNAFKIPTWLKNSLSTELYVKIGLVLLGTSVIFGDILKAGTLGLLQSLIVVISVWHFAYWLSRKLKIDDEMALMLSSAVSICGVSAAIATSGAIDGDNKKLSYVISLVLITAIPMMLFMPYAAQLLGLSPQATGAWLGGTIDTSGAVVAAGSLAGDEALKISTIVKFSQNVLLGIAAFAISLYWTYTKAESDPTRKIKPSGRVIWERFPKFIIGFIVASLLFSFILSDAQISSVKGSMKGLQGLWFALAFTSIGLETRLADLFNKDNKKPLYAFLIAQTFNIFITLIVAYICFN